tara:strand:- start:134 stop:817 length:684 start_codon:yes stop_codon:yes gene_type:complete
MSHVRINTDTLQTIFKNIQQYSINPRQTHIVAVTKKFSHMAAIEAIKNNIFCIGENQVQEFENKHQQLLTYNFEAHLIGHLQSNKINKAIKLFNVIETVDSFKLAVKLNKQLKKINQKQNIYIQINIGEDPNKHGFFIKDIFTQTEKISQLKNINLLGVMTILPYLKNLQDTQKLYAQTRQIQQQIYEKINNKCTQLSMGMSRDYIYALKEGATHIRLGTALYGQRP